MQGLEFNESVPSGPESAEFTLKIVEFNVDDDHIIEIGDANFGRFAGGRGDWSRTNTKNYVGAHVVIYCATYDGLFNNDNDFSKEYLPEIRECVPWAQVLVAQTKIDVRESAINMGSNETSIVMDRCEYKRHLVQEEAEIAGLPFFDVSAKEGTGVQALLKEALLAGAMSLEKYATWPKKKLKKHEKYILQLTKRNNPMIASNTKSDCTIL
jgi:hypothetical protein